MILFSCINDEDIPTGTTPQDDYFTMMVKVPGVAVPTTYSSLTDLQENEVKEVDVLVFEPDDSNIERYKERVRANNILPVDGYPDKSRQSFQVKLRRTNKKVRLVVIANAHDRVEAAGIASTDDKTTALNKIKYSLIDKWPTGTSTFKPFPMWGETKNLVQISSLIDLDESVIMVRAVAKIDVGIDINSDPSIGFGSRFVMSKVHACNVPDVGCVTPNMTDVTHGNNIVNIAKPNLPATYTQKIFDYDFTWSNQSESQKLFNQIYISENKKDATHRTYLIIEGNLDGDLTPTFYRIEFAKNKSGDTPEYFDIQRNYRYLINITGLKGVGYTSLEDAKNAQRGSNLQYNIDILNEDEITYISYGDQYLIGATKAVHTTGWRSEDITIPVFTNHTGWEIASITPSSAASWLTFLPTLGFDVDQKKAFNAGTTELKIRPSVNDESVIRTATLKLKAGNVELDIKVTQSPGANCIIASPGETVYIPWGIANADGTQRIDKNVSGYVLKLLWTDKSGMLQTGTLKAYNGSTFEPTLQIATGATTGGNAVVGLYNSSNEVLWSWHIWVPNTNYPIGEGRINNVTFMDRNLGAWGNYSVLPAGQGAVENNYGLSYQWGRKDPFLRSSTTGGGFVETRAEFISFTVQPVSAAENLENSIKNPLVFYTSAKDWYGTTASNNKLWDDNGEKTPYDPCPEGWRVPVSGAGSLSPWRGLDMNNAQFSNPSNTYKWWNGWKWNGLYFPVGGAFDGSSASRNDTDRTSDGYLWSATPSGFGVYGFKHSQRYASDWTYLTPVFEPNTIFNNRADALPVRCVKITY